MRRRIQRQFWAYVVKATRNAKRTSVFVNKVTAKAGVPEHATAGDVAQIIDQEAAHLLDLAKRAARERGGRK